MAHRQINEADRRSNLIALTEKGRTAAGRVREEMSAIERKLLDKHETSDLQMVREILGEVSAQL